MSKGRRKRLATYPPKTKTVRQTIEQHTFAPTRIPQVSLRFPQLLTIPTDARNPTILIHHTSTAIIVAPGDWNDLC